MPKHYRHISDRRANIPDEAVIARVKARCIIDDNGCWLWQGFTHKTGYGETSYRSGNVGVHRLMYQLHKGEIPNGLMVCHTCDVRNCCNPDHLWIGTMKENFHDCIAKGRNGHLIKTHCKNGHPYDAENTYIASNGWRHCKTCMRLNAIKKLKQSRSAETASAP